MTTFVLIHGAWLTPRSWEGFDEYLSERGHEVIVPAWPGHDHPVEEIRADPSPIDGLTLQEIVDHYADVIRDLPEQPVLVGHSFGALIVQLLLDRGFGAAGVAIDTAPPKGVRLPLSSLRTAWPVLSNPANRNRTVELTFEQFKYAFVNTWPDDDARAAYDRYAVPETGRIFFQAGTSSLTPNAANTVDYGNDDRPPLLLVAGERDHTSPPSLSRSINRKYGRSRAVTDLHEFVGRSHLLMVGDDWKEIAEDVERWVDRTLADSSHADRT